MLLAMLNYSSKSQVSNELQGSTTNQVINCFELILNEIKLNTALIHHISCSYSLKGIYLSIKDIFQLLVQPLVHHQCSL